mgnify:CR=1 FL=1
MIVRQMEDSIRLIAQHDHARAAGTIVRHWAGVDLIPPPPPPPPPMPTGCAAPILVPGIGAQGGELALSVKAGLDSGEPNLLISSSREIAYASRSGREFADAARAAAAALRDNINQTLDEVGRGW